MLVFVTVSGQKNGVLLQEVFARKIFAERDARAPLSAIQITTAAGICAAVDLFRDVPPPLWTSVLGVCLILGGVALTRR